MARFGMRHVVGAVVAIVVGSVVSAAAADCPIDHGQLAQALRASVKASGGPSNGGFENHEWASVVARDGTQGPNDEAGVVHPLWRDRMLAA